MVGKLTDKNDPNFGFDAQSGEYKDMVAAGIIDPTKVVWVALQDAASVAGTLDHHRGDGRRSTRAEGPTGYAARAAWVAWADGLLSFQTHRRPEVVCCRLLQRRRWSAAAQSPTIDDTIESSLEDDEHTFACDMIEVHGRKPRP